MFKALLDSNVLVPMALTDTLLRAAERGLFSPLWSVTILNEVRSALIRTRPDLSEPRIDSRLRAMNSQFPDAGITGFESLVNDLHFPDPDDRHVVAAALHGQATVIVTANLKDFPKASLDALGLEATSPDQFLRDLIDLFPGDIMDILAEQEAALTYSPVRSTDVLSALVRAGVPGFATDCHDLLQKARR
ncbi:MAG: PIN domain-containing protein [Micrococcales bacterium]|nr:PIN domain-containing protein [Micrococcales bacterium]